MSKIILLIAALLISTVSMANGTTNELTDDDLNIELQSYIKANWAQIESKLNKEELDLVANSISCTGVYSENSGHPIGTCIFHAQARGVSADVLYMLAIGNKGILNISSDLFHID